MLHSHYESKENDRMGGRRHRRHPATSVLRLRLCRDRGYTKIHVGCSPLLEGPQHKFPSIRTKQKTRLYKLVDNRGRISRRSSCSENGRSTSTYHYANSDDCRQPSGKSGHGVTLSCGQPSHGGRTTFGTKSDYATSQQNTWDIDFVVT